MLDYFEWILGGNPAYSGYIEIQDNITCTLHLCCFSIENKAVQFAFRTEKLELEFFSSYTMNGIEELLDKNSECISGRTITVQAH